jgi:hypothetical protein
MRNRLPFFLVLGLMTVFVFNIEAAAQWQRDDRRNDKPRRPPVIKRDNRPSRIVVVPGKQISKTNTFYRNDSFAGNDRYYENNIYGNIAQIARLNGYEDGLYEGAKDARDGDRFDPFGEHGYEDGADGYKSRYGNRAAYQQAYRQSFVRGYREAFGRYLGEFNDRKW